MTRWLPLVITVMYLSRSAGLTYAMTRVALVLRFSKNLISRTRAAARKFFIFPGRRFVERPCTQLMGCNFFRVRGKSVLVPRLRSRALNFFVWLVCVNHVA